MSQVPRKEQVLFRKKKSGEISQAQNHSCRMKLCGPTWSMDAKSTQTKGSLFMNTQFRRSKKKTFIVCLVFSLLSFSLAEASMSLVLTMEGLCRTSDTIVVGQVASSQAEYFQGNIVTRVSLSVDLPVAGSQGSDTIEVVVPGGEIDGIGQIVYGAPRLQVNQSYLLFLNSGIENTIVGLSQGAFPVREVNGVPMVQPPENLPALVQYQNGQLVSASAPVTAPVALSDFLHQIREARRGL